MAKHIMNAALSVCRQVATALVDRSTQVTCPLVWGLWHRLRSLGRSGLPDLSTAWAICSIDLWIGPCLDVR